MMRKRFAFLGVLALVLVLVFPARALAWDVIPKGVLYQTVLDGSRTGYVVSAYNQFDAAAYALGKDPNTISADAKVKLSDSVYGGKFYDYAQSFFTQSGGLDNVPTWVPTYVIMVSELADLVYADYQAVWYSTATYSLYEDAMVDFVRVLNGEDLGGGGSGGSGGSGGPSTAGSYYPLSLQAGNFTGTVSQTSRYNNAPNATFNDGVLSLGSGSTNFSFWTGNRYYVSGITLYLSSSVQRFISESILGGKEVFISTWPTGYNGANTFTLFLVVCDSYEVVRGTFDSGRENHLFINATNAVAYTAYGFKFYHDSSGIFGVLDSLPDDSVAASSYRSAYYGFGTVIVLPPDGEWPEPTTPATPDPPEVPTPTAPTVEPGPVVVAPTVTWPDIDITVNPPSVVVPTTPEGQDYTQLLTLINDNLSSIDAYLQNFYSSFNSFRSDFLMGVDSIVDGLHNIYQYLGHLNDILEVHCKHIRDQIEDSVYDLELYLKRLFEWLPQQLSFDADFNYDDSSVVNWLKQIYFKLGGGTYAPNPVADPGGFFEWLGGLVAGFLASLLSGLPGKVQELVSDVTDLTDYFPFSAPWDLYALLLLFAHDPVTPVFNIPWGMGGGHTVNVVVDCTQWDGVMAIVRSVQKIIFAGGLAKLTFDMFRPTDVMGD